jgi:alanine racemase
MSHLACADEADHPLNPAQRNALQDASALLPGVPLSLANTAGRALGPAYACDLIRPGLGLYHQPENHRHGLTLTAPVIATGLARAGESVGYGATARLDRDTAIATVGLGYADGFPRSASGKGFGVIDGVRLPILGRVSMDLITLDASRLPKPPSPGKPVEFIGPQAPLDLQANLAGTLGYELVSGLTARVRRVYDPAH